MGCTVSGDVAAGELRAARVDEVSWRVFLVLGFVTRVTLVYNESSVTMNG